MFLSERYTIDRHAFSIKRWNLYNNFKNNIRIFVKCINAL